MRTYKLKTDLPGHTDEVYCVDSVADKVTSVSRDWLLKMWVLISLSFYFFGLELTSPVQLEESDAEGLNWEFSRSRNCGGVDVLFLEFWRKRLIGEPHDARMHPVLFDLWASCGSVCELSGTSAE